MKVCQTRALLEEARILWRAARNGAVSVSREGDLILAWEKRKCQGSAFNEMLATGKVLIVNDTN